MSKFFKKKGVWIFLATTVLFFGGQVYLGVRASRLPPSADANQGFSAQGIRAMRIERNDGAKPGFLNYRELGIRFVEPATQVAVTFDSDNYALKSRVEGDVLVVTFDAQYEDGVPKRRRGRGRMSQGDEILVPSSIQSLEFSSIGRIKISTETPTDLAALDVRFAGTCPGDANFENMAVGKITVTNICQPLGPENGYRVGGSMRLSHLKASSLEITSKRGHIDFGDLVKTGTLQLNLSDDVTVEAKSALLRNARFGTAPP